MVTFEGSFRKTWKWVIVLAEREWYITCKCQRIARERQDVVYDAENWGFALLQNLIHGCRKRGVNEIRLLSGQQSFLMSF